MLNDNSLNEEIYAVASVHAALCPVVFPPQAQCMMVYIARLVTIDATLLFTMHCGKQFVHCTGSKQRIDEQSWSRRMKLRQGCSLASGGGGGLHQLLSCAPPAASEVPLGVQLPRSEIHWSACSEGFVLKRRLLVFHPNLWRV